MRIGKLTWMTGICVCAMAGAAHGEIRTFAMEGTVSYVDDPINMLDWINVGSDRMVYTFSFDSDAVDLDSAADRGLYHGLSASLQVGGTSIAVSAPTILIQHPLDLFDLQSQLAFASYPGGGGVTLSDQAENDALPNASLPSSPYDLGPWAFKRFAFGVDVPQPGYPPIVTPTFGGQIDSFYIVPEPTGASLLLIGLFLLGRRYS